MSVKHLLKTFGLISVGVLILAGCRAEEQGRITNFEPGVYKGKADTNLTESQRRILRQRTVYQGKGYAAGGGGGGQKTATQRDVRKPQDKRAMRAKLDARIRMQSGGGI